MRSVLRRPWVNRWRAAWGRLTVTNGTLYAASITFFSFLALFPLILLAVSVVGFVLSSHPDQLQRLFDSITSKAPGQAGTTLRDAVQSAIDARAGVGLVGLGGVLLTGLGWIGNLRLAIDAIWELPPRAENPVRQRLVNLVVLGALGGGVIVSVAITALWAGFSHVVLTTLGLDGIPGMGTLVGAVGILATIAADAVIFFLVLVRLPHTDVPARVGVRGALIAAVGFEILKIVGTITIASTAGSPTAGPFAGIVAVLVWIQLVSRFTLFCVAWTAEATLRPLGVPDPGAGVRQLVQASPPEAEPGRIGPSPALVATALVGVGAVAGTAVTVRRTRRRRRV